MSAARPVAARETQPQTAAGAGVSLRSPAWLASGISSVRVPRYLPTRGPLIVMYHGIGGGDGVSVAGLQSQLDALQRRRRVVPLAEAVGTIGHEEASSVAAITLTTVIGISPSSPSLSSVRPAPRQRSSSLPG